jgi:tetratricopeptide (TPR) repeat protein
MIVYTFLVAAIVAVLGGPAVTFAQPAPEATDDAPIGRPAVVEGDPAGEDGAAVEDWFSSLPAQEQKELIRKLNRMRLQQERAQVKAAIRGNVLTERKKVIEATELLSKDAADTQTDNIRRILQAFAVVDESFGKAHSLILEARDKKGKPAEANYQQAAKILKKSINPQRATYLSAAKHFLYAEALAGSGKEWQAIDAYGDLLVNMPDRVSFAAEAAVQAANVYEEMGRFYYAMQMYQFTLNNYEVTLPDPTVRRMRSRLEELDAIYSDPLKAIAGKMADVEERLAQADSGKTTQEREAEVAAILEDLIKTMEEQQKKGQGQGQGQGQGKKKQQQGKGQGKGKGQGQKQGQGQGKGKGGQAQGKNPSSPASKSYLPSGMADRPTAREDDRSDVTESGDWATMPPRKREELNELSEKYQTEAGRERVRTYHKKLAEVD